MIDIQALAEAIEPLAVRAWPARETLRLDGWLLRFTAGCSHRGNSVAALDCAGSDLDRAIEAVESEYRRRSLVPMFQVTPASRPSDLARRLVARGYRRVSPTLVHTAETADVLARLPSGGTVSCTVEDPNFRRLVTEGSRSPADGAERLEVLGRISQPHVCVLAYAEDEAAACGVGVATQEWVSFYVMRSAPKRRRQGYAKRVLAAIAAWAVELGISRLFLQVEEGNAPARALYEGAGFVPAYPYSHYVAGEDRDR